jgi:hypothetical protein
MLPGQNRRRGLGLLLDPASHADRFEKLAVVDPGHTASTASRAAKPAKPRCRVGLSNADSSGAGGWQVEVERGVAQARAGGGASSVLGLPAPAGPGGHATPARCCSEMATSAETGPT